jgi:predicted transcriptional regulator
MLSLDVTNPAVSRRIATRYGSMRKLAAAIDRDIGTVSRTLRGEIKAEKTQRQIAKALGMSRAAVFGKEA